DWFTLFSWNIKDILWYGIIFAIILVAIEIVLDKVVPNDWIDDGGINEKVFKNQSVLNIFIIALVVVISEEFLFRGFIQFTFCYIFSSSLFVLFYICFFKKI